MYSAEVLSLSPKMITIMSLGSTEQFKIEISSCLCGKFLDEVQTYFQTFKAYTLSKYIKSHFKPVGRTF